MQKTINFPHSDYANQKDYELKTSFDVPTQLKTLRRDATRLQKRLDVIKAAIHLKDT